VRSRGGDGTGSWTINSKNSSNPVSLSWRTGANYQGLARARPNDLVSVGLVSFAGVQYAQPTTAVVRGQFTGGIIRAFDERTPFQYRFVRQNPQTRNVMIAGIWLALGFEEQTEACATEWWGCSGRVAPRRTSGRRRARSYLSSHKRWPYWSNNHCSGIHSRRATWGMHCRLSTRRR